MFTFRYMTLTIGKSTKNSEVKMTLTRNIHLFPDSLVKKNCKRYVLIDHLNILNDLYIFHNQNGLFLYEQIYQTI